MIWWGWCSITPSKEQEKIWKKEERKQATLFNKYKRYLKKINALTYDEWLATQ